jgi:pilus assembly protein CpaE
MHVTLLCSDRQLEDTVRGLGYTVAVQPVTALANIAAGTVAPSAIAIIDVRGSSVIPPAIHGVRRNFPQTTIVLVVSTLDSALLLEAMRAGVNEVIAHPADAGELQKVMQRVAGTNSGSEPGNVHGFVGAKGGVGTTTIAVNIATALGSLSAPGRTLLVDFHRTGGDAALFTGVEPRFSIIDALENTHRLDEVFFKTLVVPIAPGTDLLASPERLVRGSFERHQIQQVIAFAASIYRHTVLDVPRFDTSVLEALEHVSNLYVVANQELATVRSANRLFTTMRERYGTDKVKLVLSRSDGAAEISHADVEKAAGGRVAYTFPSNYRVALQAVHKGRPLALENHNNLSAAFKGFAHVLAGSRSEKKPARPAGLFGRLTHSRS